jgi:hypothetical protein
VRQLSSEHCTHHTGATKSAGSGAMTAAARGDTRSPSAGSGDATALLNSRSHKVANWLGFSAPSLPPAQAAAT